MKITRRTAIRTAGGMGGCFVIPSIALSMQSDTETQIKLGVIADLHGGLAVDAAARLDKFLRAMGQEGCDALIQLGDFAFPNSKHQRYADKFNAAHRNTLHVIGNHEFDYGLKRDDCLKAWGIDGSYYRKEIGRLTVLILDGNEAGSPTHKGGYPSYIGNQQQQWLEKELDRASNPVLILSHQPLAGTSAIDNHSEVQEILSRHSSKILLCLNGHSHVDSLLKINDISYLHINSASYYWVGGKTRMAYYADPLFTTVTLNPQTATIQIASKASTWRDKSPEQIGYFEREGVPPQDIVTPQIRARSVTRHRTPK